MGEPEKTPSTSAAQDEEARLRDLLGGQRDLTLRYMSEYHCIGPDCEDNCCRTWGIAVDKKSYDKLIMRTAGKPEERKKIRTAIRKEKGKRGVTKYWVRLNDDDRCPLLLPGGLCYIHGTFGEDCLPDICAIYPRMLTRVGKHVQLTGTVSCPEVGRKLLLHDDALDVVELDRETLPRILVVKALSDRDVRPYWRLQTDVRSFMMSMLRRTDPLEHRLFYMTYFAHRTGSIFTRNVVKGGQEAVHEEMDRLRNEDFLKEIARRLDSLETPNRLVLILTKELVRRPKPSRNTHDFFGQFIQRVLQSYQLVVATADDDDNDAPPTVATMSTREGWQEYLRRKARVLELERARFEQYFAHFAFNFWVQQPYVQAPDLLVYMQRLLTLMAIQRFLLVSHPTLDPWLDDDPADAPTGASFADSPDTFRDVLDRAAVEVFYQVGRDIEHSPLLNNLEKSLEEANMRSFGGALYLIRF